MGKNRDLIIILLIVIVGMFIPFIGSLLIMFGFDISTIKGWLIIGRTFGWFLLIFGLELGVVYLYFSITNTLAQKKINKEAFEKRK
jgi:nitric oxide reductase large subunit